MDKSDDIPSLLFYKRFFDFALLVDFEVRRCYNEENLSPYFKEVVEFCALSADGTGGVHGRKFTLRCKIHSRFHGCFDAS